MKALFFGSLLCKWFGHKEAKFQLEQHYGYTEVCICLRCAEAKVLNVVNAARFGLSEENSGEENSKALQDAVDFASKHHQGTQVYVPKGEYKTRSSA